MQLFRGLASDLKMRQWVESAEYGVMELFPSFVLLGGFYRTWMLVGFTCYVTQNHLIAQNEQCK